MNDFDERTVDGVLSLLASIKKEHGNNALYDVDMWGWSQQRTWFQGLPANRAADYIAGVWTARSPRLSKDIKMHYLRY